MSQGQSYHHGNLKEALVKAATELLEEGTAASELSLRMVARRAGVSHAAPYAHFQDKEDLIAAIKDEAFAALLAEITERLEREQSGPAQRLVVLARTYIQFAARNPGKFDIMFRRALQKSPAPGQHYSQAGMTMFGTLTRLLGELIYGQPVDNDGKSWDQTPLIRKRALLAWSNIHGLCVLRVGGTLVRVASDRKFEEVAEESIKELIDLVSHVDRK